MGALLPVSLSLLALFFLPLLLFFSPGCPTSAYMPHKFVKDATHMAKGGDSTY